MLFRRKKKNYFIIIGPQGSGKGTQGEFICSDYNIPQISIGAILRENMAIGTELGKKVAEHVNNGSLVSDEIVLELISKRLKEKDAANGALFDGFPRNIIQAKALDKRIEIKAVINQVVSDDIVIERISNRRVCESCGKTFIATEIKDKTKCECGRKIIIREDDTKEAVIKRLETFKLQTAPVLEHYKNKVINVDASKTIAEIKEDIKTKLKEFLK